MLKTIVSIVLLVVSLISFIGFIVQRGILVIKTRDEKGSNKKSNLSLKISIISLIGLVFLVGISQINVDTPKIDGEMAISELIKVEINNQEQWVSIRGRNRNNPIILFLAGGPGGSQIGAVRRNLSALEKEYVVVNWEQPGSGKSFNSIATEDLTVENYIVDGIAVTNYLRERFEKDKIYLMGESWGSALGVFLVKEQPDLFYAFIGTGQMVAFEETEGYCYDLAMDIAKEKKDIKQIEKLEEIGPPPYYGNGMALTTATYLQYLSNEMSKNPNIHNAGYATFDDLASKEYGIIDQVNFFRGMLRTFSEVYPQLYSIDLRNDYSDLEVPIYIFHGKYDLNAPSVFVEEYYEQLKAPEKKLIWFEHSGHSPWINENTLFCDKTSELFVHHNQ